MSRASIAVLVSSVVLGGISPAFSAALNDLRPHRAVYDLSMDGSSDRSGITGMNGRIVYEVKGSACEGFAVRFRFLTNVQTPRKSFTNDQRTTTFESGDGETFTFVTQGYLNGQLEEEIRGSAEQSDTGVSVSLTAPDEQRIDLEPALFQTQHVSKLIDAARAGETIVTANIYDGSDQGDEIMETTAIIGKPKTVGAGDVDEPDDVTKAVEGQTVWPVSVSYFSTSGIDNQGEKMPAYAVSFLMQEDGVSRDLKMQYPDYALRGKLANIEYFEEDDCKTSN